MGLHGLLRMINLILAIATILLCFVLRVCFLSLSLPLNWPLESPRRTQIHRTTITMITIIIINYLIELQIGFCPVAVVLQ
jgi:hypothetical protein